MKYTKNYEVKHVFRVKDPTWQMKTLPFRHVACEILEYQRKIEATKSLRGKKISLSYKGMKIRRSSDFINHNGC